MLLNSQQLKHTFQNRVVQLKHKYQTFRLYDVGSRALNRITSKSSYTVQKDVAYGEQDRQRLDIYCATKPHKIKPLLVFVHGGAWQHGDKEDYVFIGESFTREGYDVAVINYRLAPLNIFPSYVDDLALALNFLHQQQASLNISTQHIILMGHSAGAFNIMSVLYPPAETTLDCRENIKTVIGIAGPYHFDYFGDPLAQDAFNQEIPYHNVMPYYFVDSNSIQHYLIVAENDRIVHVKNSQDFDQALKQHGNFSQIVTIPRVGHISVIATLASLFSRFFSTKKEVLACMNQSLKQ